MVGGDDVLGTGLLCDVGQGLVSRVAGVGFQIAVGMGQVQIDALYGQVELACQLGDKPCVTFGLVAQMVLNVAHDES